MGKIKETGMTEQQAVSFLRQKGVKIEGNSIPRGSYGLKVWSAIDCLLNYIGGYHLVG